MGHVKLTWSSNLDKLGVKTKVDLPGVGENMIEQPLAAIGYSGDLPDTTGTTTPFGLFVNAQDVFGDQTSSIAASTRANLTDWAAQVSAANGGIVDADALLKVYEVQHDLIFKHNVTIGEILTVFAVLPGYTFTGNVIWPLLPFSRGSVHLKSLDAINDPVIDPKYLLADFDLTTMTGVGRVAQSLFYQAPFGDLITGNVLPGDSVLPRNATDEQWQSMLETTGKQH